MPAPSTDLVKAWARIDGSEYDALLPTMINSAMSLASHATGVDYTTEDMPPSVQQWCAAHVAYWISNPEAEKQASPFLARLLDPHRTFAS